MTSNQTPSQTVGPYFAYGLTAEQYRYPNGQIADGAIANDKVADRIRIVGRVLDGEGRPIPDAMVEIWQADRLGRYNQSGAGGFGRQGTGTDPESRFVFDTVKPGSVGGGQAPHLTVILFMRGLLSHLFTRIYFADEAEANLADPVLAAVPAERRQTLVARREDTANGPVYTFDIRMQGDGETVFFDF